LLAVDNNEVVSVILIGTQSMLLTFLLSSLLIHSACGNSTRRAVKKRHCYIICVQGVKKRMNKSSQDSVCLSQGSNWVPPKYKSEVLPLEPGYAAYPFLFIL
jgi:hypothetical protein